jgi:hypothetical protein
LAVLAKRFEKYTLTLHPQKTRLIALHRPNSNDRGRIDCRLDGFARHVR